MAHYKIKIDTNGKDIIYDYCKNNIRIKQLSIKYKLSAGTISIFLRKQGIKIKQQKPSKYTLNINYFENIDSEDKAYWLGFLYADGCMHKNLKTLQLCLSIDDIDHIKKFMISLNSTYPVVIYNRDRERLRPTKGTFKNIKDSATVFICNQKFCKILTEKGCIPKKSLVLKFPTENQVPKDLIHHFIRRIF